MAAKWLVCIFACIFLAGCSPGDVFESPLSSAPPEPPETQQWVPQTLRLPVNLNDSLNPYLLTTQANRSAVALLYDGLYRLTPSYTASPVLAAGGVMLGDLWRVQIKQGATFADGTPLTAADVVYSFKLAAALGSPYYTQMRQVLSCYEENGGVVFSLVRPNALFSNNLTFPILKLGTGEGDTPVGSGRFVISERDRAGVTLIPRAGDRRSGTIREVRLIAMSDNSEIAYSLQIGAINMMQTTQSSREELLSGVSSQPLDINALGFIAINQTRSPLGSAAVRRAIYLSIDREELVQFSYGSKAAAAYTPFNPVVDWLPDAEFVGRDGQARAEAVLEENGYVKGETEVRSDGGGELRFELLVNSESSMRISAAQRIKEQLGRSGISITVVGKPYEEYLEDYMSGSYDLCLAEMQLGDDMSLAEVLPGIENGFGRLSDSYAAFLADTRQADVFLAEFLEQNPFIPLAYRYGMLASSRNFPAHIVATKWDIFYNMYDW